VKNKTARGDQGSGHALSGTNLERAGDHNQRVTLHAIRVNGPITRTDLVSLTGLTAPAVANITKRLLQENLIKEAGRARGGLGQPPVKLVINPDGRFSVGINVDRDHITLLVLDFEGQVRSRLSREIRFAPFTAAIFRGDLFQRVGLLDEEFGSYLEDIDFGIRCSLAGFTGIYAPQAVAYHTGSATLGRWHRDTVQKISRNQLLLIAKHYPPKWILRYGWPVFIAQSLWGLVALRHGAAIAYLQGKLEGLRRFQQTRGNYSVKLPAILERSENELRELQQLTGFDLYWKLYFALT